MKTTIIKNEVKLDRMKSKLEYDNKKKFSTVFNQKIESIASTPNKDKYGMKLSSGLLDVSVKSGGNADYFDHLFHTHSITTHSLLVLFFVFSLSLFVIFSIKSLIDWLVSVKSKNLPQTEIQIRESILRRTLGNQAAQGV